MKRILIKNCRIVNEGKICESDILVEGKFISKIESSIKITRLF